MMFRQNVLTMFGRCLAWRSPLCKDCRYVRALFAAKMVASRWLVLPKCEWQAFGDTAVQEWLTFLYVYQVLIFHVTSFVGGYYMTRLTIGKNDVPLSRCISLETGMQVPPFHFKLDLATLIFVYLEATLLVHPPAHCACFTQALSTHPPGVKSLWLKMMDMWWELRTNGEA